MILNHILGHLNLKKKKNGTSKCYQTEKVKFNLLPTSITKAHLSVLSTSSLPTYNFGWASNFPHTDYTS